MDEKPFAVVVWRWGGVHSKYTAYHVNAMKNMVKRNLTVPHRFYCFTDDFHGLDKDIIPFPMPNNSHAYRKQSRRLFIFSTEMEKLVGKRLMQLDIDQVIVRNIDHLVQQPNDFMIWRSPSMGGFDYAYNPSLIVMDTGSRASVWDEFKRDPNGLIMRADKAGWVTRADQSVISYLLADHEKTFGMAHGIYSTRDQMDDCRAPLPENACLLSFYGKADPSHKHLQDRAPWIREHWR